MRGQENEVTAEIMRLFQQEEGRRGNWDNHWQEIKERIWPGTQDFKSKFNTDGKKNNELIFDVTAGTALNRFASILDSYLTPRNQTWHRVMSSIDELNKNREVRLYYEDVTRILFKYRYANVANFASQNIMYNKSLGAFGSGVQFVDAAVTEPGIRYKTCHLGEIYFMENHQGIIDQLIRHFPMTARQASQKWKDKCPEFIKAAYEKDQGQIFWFIHYVGPRDDMDIERLDAKGMPWRSHYISVTGGVHLEEGGYNTWPYPSSRY